MKFSLAILAVAAVAQAQTAASIPKCAVPCLDDAVKANTKCSTTDYACICQKANFSAVQGAATGCVIEKCGSDVALSKVLPAVQALCAAAGKPSSTAVAAPSTSAEAATTAEATSLAVETTMSAPVYSAPQPTTSSAAPVYTPPSPPASYSVPPVSNATPEPTTLVYTTPGSGAGGSNPTGTGSVPAPTTTAPTAGAATYGSAGLAAILAVAALAL